MQCALPLALCLNGAGRPDPKEEHVGLTNPNPTLTLIFQSRTSPCFSPQFSALGILWVDVGCSRRIGFGSIFHFPKLRNVFIITTAGAAAVYRMQRLSKPREQHLHPHIGQSEVHEKALAATFLCALAIALYPSTAFAVHCTSSSQSAHCRNRRGTQKSRSWQL
jgi:hypothetical protein